MSSQLHDGLHMMRVGKQIHGLDDLDSVRLFHHAQVASLRLWIATQVDEAFGSEGGDPLGDFGVQPRTGWIDDQYVRCAVCFDEISIEDLQQISRYKGTVFDVVRRSVCTCVFDGLGDEFHPYDLRYLIRHENGDGAGAAVQVVDDIIGRQTGELPRDLVQALRLSGVRLKKGVRRDFEGMRANPIVNHARAVYDPDLLTKRGLRL